MILSPWFLIGSIGLFILQVVPATGMYLMFFGGVLWTGILFALFLVALAMEAWRGYIHRAWLIVPVGVLFGYYAFVIAQRIDIFVVGSTLAPQRASVTFDPAKDHLLLDYRESVMGDQRSAARLLDLYQIDTVFITHQLGGYDKLDRRPADKCTNATKAWTLEPSRFFDHFDAPTGPVELCLTENTTLPDGRLITAASKRSALKRPYKSLLSSTTMTEGDVSFGSFTVGVATVYGLVPFMVAGCGLMTGPGTPYWQCGVSPFDMDDVVVGSPRSDAVATVLGLPLRNN